MMYADKTAQSKEKQIAQLKMLEGQKRLTVPLSSIIDLLNSFLRTVDSTM